MDTTKLAKNIAKPYFIDNIQIKNFNIKEDFQIVLTHDNLLNFIVYLKFNIYSKNNDNLNDVNILTLVQWFNSFKYIQIVDWDDDKEFDFSDINNIKIIIKFDLYNFLKNKLKEDDFYRISKNIIIERHFSKNFNDYIFDEIKCYFNENDILLIE